MTMLEPFFRRLVFGLIAGMVPVAMPVLAHQVDAYACAKAVERYRQYDCRNTASQANPRACKLYTLPLLENCGIDPASIDDTTPAESYAEKMRVEKPGMALDDLTPAQQDRIRKELEQLRLACDEVPFRAAHQDCACLRDEFLERRIGEAVQGSAYRFVVTPGTPEALALCPNTAATIAGYHQRQCEQARALPAQPCECIGRTVAGRYLANPRYRPNEINQLVRGARVSCGAGEKAAAATVSAATPRPVNGTQATASNLTGNAVGCLEEIKRDPVTGRGHPAMMVRNTCDRDVRILITFHGKCSIQTFNRGVAYLRANQKIIQYRACYADDADCSCAP